MKAWTRIEPAAIDAPLNFLRPMKERPVSYQIEPPPGVPVRTGQYDAHRVAIHNARPKRGRLSLDVEGFALVAAPEAVDYDDEAAVRADYYPAVEAALAAATGAELVVNFDHNVRSLARAGEGEAGVRGPVDRTHNDFTLRSGPERARTELERRGLDADAWLKRRFAIVNLWRPIGRGGGEASARLVRRADDPAERPDRGRPRLSRPDRRDLCAAARSRPALVLFPEAGAGRGDPDQGL